MYIVSLVYKEITFHSIEMYNSTESSGVLGTKINGTESENICNYSHLLMKLSTKIVFS